MITITGIKNTANRDILVLSSIEIEERFEIVS